VDHVDLASSESSAEPTLPVCALLAAKVRTRTAMELGMSSAESAQPVVLGSTATNVQ
jgi:hypothetical protein